MLTVTVAGCVAVVKTVRGRLDEARALQQPMITQMTMGRTP